MSILEKNVTDMSVFETCESEVRSYCRSFPTIFDKARGAKMWDINGQEFIDFFAGAGALNYGHNNPLIKQKLVDYLTEDHVVHSLDMATVAKETFLKKFRDVVLMPRKMDYKVMFPGPTGANAVESALKLARKVTGRQTVISFTKAFHGMTLGALSVTGNSFKRHGAGVPLHHAVSMPFDNYHDDVDSLTLLERYLDDEGSGIEVPAAIILETLQGEGGINVASSHWLKRIQEICRQWDILLIVDDVQVGCGRTGPFFSFERAPIQPDIVCLSKSIGGYGLPFAITLIKPSLDEWAPGEHNGTFRGHNLAFVAATEALSYWETDGLEKETLRKGEIVRGALQAFATKYPQPQPEVRGLGLMQGIAFTQEGFAEKVCRAAFERGLIMETSGPDSEVAKVMPPLTIDDEELHAGLKILEESIQASL